MKIVFQKDDHLSADDLQVIVQASEQNDAVNQVLAYLGQFRKTIKPVDQVSIKDEDELRLVKIEQIIGLDVQVDHLQIYTTIGTFVTRERLVHFLGRVNQEKLVQVSKHGVINLDHLLALANSFSGNMTAKLTGGQTLTVSRRYVKTLMEKLGM